MEVHKSFRMTLTVYRFIENHCCYEDEKHCPHVVWSALEGRIQNALYVIETKEILWLFSLAAEVGINIAFTLAPGIAGMRPRTLGLFQKHRHVGEVDGV